MEESKSLRFAGDVNINKIQIISSSGFFQNVTAQVINIQYYEDIFSPFISGSLILKDSLDLPNLFPFVGEEYVDLDISTPGIDKDNIKGRYYIYKMTDRELLGDRSATYQLHFISVEAIIDLNKKVSKAITGNAAEVVKKIVADKIDGLQSSKECFVEPTTKAIKFIPNFWSPVKCIQHITEQAVNQNQSPSYIFFENRFGFYFLSLESLYDNNVYQDFKYDKYTRDKTGSGATHGDAKNPSEDYKRITQISIPKSFDYMDRIMNGTFASKVISFDLTYKKYQVKNYNMFDKFEKKKHLNPNAISSSKSIFRNASKIVNYPRATDTFVGFGDTSTFKTFQERLSLFKQLEAMKLEIEVPGRCDYTVGQKVNVELTMMEPIKKSDSDADTVDKLYSGNYLIAAVNHYIDRDMHTCHMELVKDSLQKNLESGK